MVYECAGITPVDGWAVRRKDVVDSCGICVSPGCDALEAELDGGIPASNLKDTVSKFDPGSSGCNKLVPSSLTRSLG